MLCRLDSSLTLVALSILCSLLGANASPLGTTNSTVEVPSGTSNHGNPHLLCLPTQWADIAAFYVGNFIAHAATVKSYPGESGFDRFQNAALSLFFPTWGIIRGLNMIMRHSVFHRNNKLEAAARTGALCMVVRLAEEWKPKSGDVIRNAILQPSESPFGCHPITVIDDGKPEPKIAEHGDALQGFAIEELEDLQDEWQIRCAFTYSELYI